MMNESASAKARRFCKHTLFSLAGTATDTFVLWLCSSFFFKGFATENILSPFISFECANLVNYIMSDKFVFGDRTKGLPFIAKFKNYLEYNLSYTTTFFMKLGLLLLIQLISKWDVVWCNLIALCFTGVANFFLNDLLIFRDKIKTNLKTNLKTKQ